MDQFIPAFIIAYSNSDFTNPHEVIQETDPLDCTKDFTHMGVKYWGLETCRHKACAVDSTKKSIQYNHNSYHWLRVGFQRRAVLSTLSVSTRWFTGNQVRAISVRLIDEHSNRETEVLSRVILQPDQEHRFQFEATEATEALIQLYYEGGISRINFFGEIAPIQLPDKKNLLKSAQISHVSNDHYGHPAMAVNGERKEMHMLGWESARTGFGEQALFHLASPARVEEVVVDTYLHRLNAPLTCHLFGLNISKESLLEEQMKNAPRWKIRYADGIEVIPENFQQFMLNEKYLETATDDPTVFEIILHLPESSEWKPLLPFEVLRADTYHRFFPEQKNAVFSHLLYMHYPNGGIHGLKVFGTEMKSI